MKYPDIDTHAKSAEKVWGEAYDTLWPLIKEKNLKVGVEVGVAFGGHSERILSCTKSKLYCVDPYKHFEDYHDAMNVSNQEFNRLYRYTKERLSVFGSRCKMVRKTSLEAARIISEPLDFVYIDGDHSAEGVKKDIYAWFPKIKDGGIIAGHDYGHPNFPGVKTTVDKYFSRFNWEIHQQQGGAWWVEKKPLHISYIIPAYNCGNTIEESVKSIYNHNFANGDELVIVNDGSTDNTKEILAKIAKKYHDIKIYNHKYNRGGGATRNTAIENSKHELIFCLDSDNILASNSVTELKDLLISQGVDVASFQKLKYFSTSYKHTASSWTFKEKIYNKNNYLSSIYVPGASGNYIFTKSSWQLSGYYPVDTYLDTWGFGLRQVMSGSQIAVLPRSYYYHRIDPNSYWRRESSKLNPSLAALQLLLPYYFQLNLHDLNLIMSSAHRLTWFEKLGASIHLRTKIEDYDNPINKLSKIIRQIWNFA